MITHGNKQISEIVYARKASEGGGAVRLTNIIRGAQVVFGDLYPAIWWLTGATKAAILAAFGQTDGKAVIKATNAYLKGLAATDYDKATALVGFINEDPMMVCSLGLQPQGVEMPIRWLVGDGNAFIRSGVIANADSGIELEFRTLISNNTHTGLLSVDELANYRAFGVGRWDGKFTCWYGNRDDESIRLAMDVGVIYYYKQNRGHVEIKGSNGGSEVNNITLGSSSIFPGEFYYPATNRNGKVPTSGGLYESAMVKIYNNDVLVRHFIPYQHDNQAGMLDIVGGTFYPNVNTSGSFSIVYTLHDGTPWTPLNQTP